MNVSLTLTANNTVPASNGNGTASRASSLLFCGTMTGACEAFVHAQTGRWHATAGTDFFGQHGCAGALGAGIKQQYPIAFSRRKVTMRTANPNFDLVSMAPFTHLQCTRPTTPAHKTSPLE